MNENVSMETAWGGMCNTAKCSAEHHRRRCPAEETEIKQELEAFCALGAPTNNQEMTIREMRLASMTKRWRDLRQ